MEKMEENYRLTMIQSDKSHEATMKAALGDQAEELSKKLIKYQAEKEALEATYEG